MKKIEKIKKNIEQDKGIMKSISKDKYRSIDNLIEDIQSYIKALKDGRLRYSVISVSQSGMSRIIEVSACIKADKGYYKKYYYRFYTNMLINLGYSVNKEHNIRVNGCGMNMLFATNYNLIHKFCELGFISKKQCEILAQKVN